ncbi:CASP-like protein 1C1 [Coffea arabica]|uniref:CASP-like protein n=1 Tax=Coffea arabica TaxID=13443 RepID=A0A6P6U7V0_COFAR|nr:CASP-like protein 1C1 [Coffea arabica]
MTKTKSSIIARNLAFVSAIVAAIVMATGSEKIETDDYVFIAKFDNWNSFKYFFAANVFGGLYNLLVLLLPSGSLLWRPVLGLDMVVNVILSTSLSAAFRTVKAGNSHTNWSPVCIYVPNFCGKVFGALIMGSIGCTVNFLLLCYSLHVIVNPLLLLPE